MSNLATNALIDLGDAVGNTKGTAMMGVVDSLSGFRHTGGLFSED